MTPRPWFFVTLAALAVGFTVLAAVQDGARAAAPVQPVTFAHKDHVDVLCMDCHHDYVDDSGFGLCIDCHKTDPEVAHLIEAQFHGLCRNCHIEEGLIQPDHGPLRQCEACHTPDPYP